MHNAIGSYSMARAARLFAAVIDTKEMISYRQIIFTWLIIDTLENKINFNINSIIILIQPYTNVS